MTNTKLIAGSEHALTFKTLADAIFLRRNHVIQLFETADVETDPRRTTALLTFVFIGGGLINIELCGEIIDFLKALQKLYNRVNFEDMRIEIVEGEGSIAREFEEDLREYIADTLTELGVKIPRSTPASRRSSRARSISPTGPRSMPRRSFSGPESCPARCWLSFRSRRTRKAEPSLNRRCSARIGKTSGRWATAPRFPIRPGGPIRNLPSTPCAKQECWPETSRRPSAACRWNRSTTRTRAHSPRSGTLSGSGQAGQAGSPRFPGLVDPPDLLPAANARLRPQAARGARLDNRTVLQERHRAIGSVRIEPSDARKEFGENTKVHELTRIGTNEKQEERVKWRILLITYLRIPFVLIHYPIQQAPSWFTIPRAYSSRHPSSDRSSSHDIWPGSKTLVQTESPARSSPGPTTPAFHISARRPRRQLLSAAPRPIPLPRNSGRTKTSSR